MKMTKLAAAMAATVVSAAHALDFSTVDTNPSGTAINVGACAIVAATDIADGLRTIQGGDAACAGSTDAACAPSLSSAELRALATGAVNNATNILGDGGNLDDATGIKKGALVFNIADGCDNAVRAFAGSSAGIGGLSCGQGPATLATAGNDAAVLGTLTNGQSNHRMGIISSTSLADTHAFIKLDGVAPSVEAVASSNYNLVSNLAAAASVADNTTNGITVGIVAADSGNGVAYHQVAGNAVGCAPLAPGGALTDANGGAL